MDLSSVECSEVSSKSVPCEELEVPRWIAALVKGCPLKGKLNPPTADELQKWECFYQQEMSSEAWRLMGTPTLKKAFHSVGILLLYALPTLAEFKSLGDKVDWAIHMMGETHAWSLGNCYEEPQSTGVSLCVKKDFGFTVWEKLLLRRILTFTALDCRMLSIEFDIVRSRKLWHLQMPNDSEIKLYGYGSGDVILYSLYEIHCSISWDPIRNPIRRIAGKLCKMLFLKAKASSINNQDMETILVFSLPFPMFSLLDHVPVTYKSTGERKQVVYGDDRLYLQETEYEWLREPSFFYRADQREHAFLVSLERRHRRPQTSFWRLESLYRMCAFCLIMYLLQMIFGHDLFAR